MNISNPFSKSLKTLVLLSGMVISSLGFSNPAVQVDKNSVILAGHDAVSYFTESAAVEGYAGISTAYNDAIYHFSSEANRDAFKANPAKYAPQYGGFCAYGTSVGKKFDVDGKAFEVVDGKLYVQKNEDVNKIWAPEKVSRITTADTKWLEIKDIVSGRL